MFLSYTFGRQKREYYQAALDDFMKYIPEPDNSLVLRTDFSDEEAWRAICNSIRRPVGEFQFQPNVEFVSDPAFSGVGVEELPALIHQSTNHTFLFVVDRMALAHPEHPILVMDLYEEAGRTFRVVPSEMWSVENNLSISNMDFAEFAAAVDPDGVFRGFREG